MNAEKINELDEDTFEAILAAGAVAGDPADAILKTLWEREIDPSTVSLDLMKELVVRVFHRRRFGGCNQRELMLC